MIVIMIISLYFFFALKSTTDAGKKTCVSRVKLVNVAYVKK